jgi:MFS family permease
MGKLFYGWVIVAVGAIIGCIGMGGLMAFGVFLEPMADTLGWSRAGISSGSTLAFLWMSVGGFLWGWLSDRHGVRKVVFLGGLLQGTAFVLASKASSLPMFLALFGGGIGLSVGAVFVPVTAAAASWFTRHRSLAVSLVSAGMAMGTTLVAPLARWLIMTHDWRFAMFTLGLLSWAVMLPGALLLRPAPIVEDRGTARSVAAGPGRPDMTLAQALGTPLFWSLAIANFACCAAHSGPIFHMVANAANCGVAPMTAATVLGSAGIAALTGRILCGLLADRAGVTRVLVASLALQALAIALYLVARDLTTLYAVSMLFGFSYGGAMPLYAILVREHFPARIMGSVFGLVSGLATVGMAIGPLMGGWVFDRSGGYGWLFVTSAVLGAVAFLVAMTVRPHRSRPMVLAPSA